MKLKKKWRNSEKFAFSVVLFYFFAHTIKEFYIVFIVKKPKGSLTKGKYVLKKMSIFRGEMVILKNMFIFAGK